MKSKYCFDLISKFSKVSLGLFPTISVALVLSTSPAQAEYRATVVVHQELQRISQASHFLSQASMGGSIEEINALANRINVIGQSSAYEEWIDNQLNLPRGTTLTDQARDTASADGIANGDNNIGKSWDRAWLDQAVNAEDQLRHRVAFALSQIAVVSTVYWNNLLRAGRYLHHVRYYDSLMDNAFNTHRDLLEFLTYSPMMGVWLSSAQNSKGNPSEGIFPDENYAREILQLFSMGVFERDAWGNFVPDSNGGFVENYTQNDIAEFAQVFTGLSIDNNAPFFAKNLTLIGSYPMKLVESEHDTTAKNLLNGVTLPANQSARADISQALDNISSHPSTAANFSRLLIQRLTTSNPSSEYMKRVTDAWNGGGEYGTGIEGDFKAVIKAILLDTEARDAVSYSRGDDGDNLTRVTAVDPLSAKINEPLLKYTRLLRLIKPVSDSDDGKLRMSPQHLAFGQNVLAAPSVFNFYSSEFAPSSGPLGDYVANLGQNNPGGPSMDITAPEAQILARNVIGEYERMHDMLMSESLAYTNFFSEHRKFSGNNAKNIDVKTELTLLSGEMNDLFTNDSGLVRFFDAYLCNSQVPYELAQQLAQQFNPVANREDLAKVVSILYSSPACSVTY